MQSRPLPTQFPRKGLFGASGGHGPRPALFAFDLDGTVTACEMLPVIARLSEHADAVALLTQLTLKGHIAFEPSFRTRFSLLRRIPLAKVHKAVEAIPLDAHIEAFIRRRQGQCALITGNLDAWIAPLVNRLGCRCFSSRGMISTGGLKLLSVLNKGRAVSLLNREGWRVIAVGESVNDIPMLQAAAVGVAFAGVHRPVPEIRRLARYEAANGEALCALLDSLDPAPPAQETRKSENTPAPPGARPAPELAP